jgi:hypothetical protein
MQKYYYFLLQMSKFSRKNKTYQIRNPDQCCRKECWTLTASSSVEFGAKTKTDQTSILNYSEYENTQNQKYNRNCLQKLLRSYPRGSGRGEKTFKRNFSFLIKPTRKLNYPKFYLTQTVDVSANLLTETLYVLRCLAKRQSVMQVVISTFNASKRLENFKLLWLS